MKTPSSHLHDLVSTLTKSEKRYLKVQAGNGNKDYLQLLDALVAQKVFDEDQLVQDHQGANFLKNLAVNKRYLYTTILDALARFSQQKVEDKVHRQISRARVLMDKGLYAAAQSELKKGQKTAVKYEFFDLQILISSVAKRLLSPQQLKKKTTLAIRQIFDAERNCLQQLTNTNQYWQLAQQLAQFQLQFQRVHNDEQRKRLDKLIESPLFHDVSLAINFKSKIYYYQLQATYHFIAGNGAQAYAVNNELLDLLEKRPHFLRLYAERYLATLNNMLIDSLVKGKYDQLAAGIKRLDSTLERPEFKRIKHIEARVFRQRYLLLINWRLAQKDFDKALAWIPDIEQGLEKFGKQIQKHHRITFYYLVAYILFQNRRYSQALEWNNLIINDPKEDVVKEIFYFARVLNLLIHYELGNHSLLQSLLQSTPKYLRSRRQIYATEKFLFRFLGQLINTIDKREKQQLTDDFKLQLVELYLQPTEQRVFNYLDLRFWLSQ